MEIALALVATIVTQVLKERVWTRWGDSGVHFVIFVFAVAGASIWVTAQGNQNLMDILVKGWEVLLLAIGFYEIILKKFLFKTLKEMGVKKETE